MKINEITVNDYEEPRPKETSNGNAMAKNVGARDGERLTRM